MNSATATAIKQFWSRDDTVLITRCYLDGKSLHETHLIMPDIKLYSLKTKFANCVYLDKRDDRTRFEIKNVSKMHLDVWNELKEALAVPSPEEWSILEDEGSDQEEKEDGETYFMCAGSCDYKNAKQLTEKNNRK